jgi:cytochrome P450
LNNNKILSNFIYNQRLHNILPAHSRQLTEDLTIDQFTIPKGVKSKKSLSNKTLKNLIIFFFYKFKTITLLGSSYTTKSPRFFNNPYKFDPLRWERDQIDPYASLPFGFGQRMCLGKRVAEQEIYLTIVKLVQNFEIEYNEEAPGIKTGLFLAPDKPLNIVLKRRNYT